MFIQKVLNMSTNRNHSPSTSPEFTQQERDVFSIDKLNEWRDRQSKSLDGYREDFSENPNYVEDFKNSIDVDLEAYLAQNDIDTAAPNYDEIRRLFRDASIDRIRENEWGNSPASRGVDADDHKSERDKFSHIIEERLGSNGTSNGPEDDSNSQDLCDEALLMNAEFDDLNQKLEATREEWAKASSKMLGRAFSLKDKKRNDLRENYESLVRERGRWMLDNNLLVANDIEGNDNNRSTDAKNAAVVAYLLDEQHKLRDMTLEDLKGSKVSKFVEWMNKGNVATRIAKGMSLGVVAGVGGSMLAGAAGAGLLAAGVVGASRFVRGFASKDRHRGAVMSEQIDEDGKDYIMSDKNGDGVVDVDQAHAKTNELLKDDVREEQRLRRVSLAMGSISVAAGAGIGYVLGNIGYLNDAKNYIHEHTWDKLFGGADVNADGQGNDVDSTGSDNDNQPSGQGEDANADEPDTGAENKAIDDRSLPVVDAGEGLNSFVGDNYGENLSYDDSMELGEALHEQGFMYESDALSDAAGQGNPYGISEAGQIDAKTDETIRDFLDDNKLNNSVDSIHETSSVTDTAEIGDSDAQDIASQGDSVATNMAEVGDDALQDATGSAGDSITSSDINSWVDSGQMDKFSAIDQDSLKELYNYMGGKNGLTYENSNGFKIVDYSPATGNYFVNQPLSYNSELPKEASDRLKEFFSKHDFDLAA
jgi:hypothetical protein